MAGATFPSVRECRGRAPWIWPETMARAMRERVERFPIEWIATAPERAQEWSTPYVDGLSGPLTREVLARALREVCGAAGAAQFCLADLSRSHAEEPPRVLSSNWSFDAIDMIGTASIELLHQSSYATPLGQAPRAFAPRWTGPGLRIVDQRTAALFEEFGHEELFLLKLRAGARRGVCLLSGSAGTMGRDQLQRAHMTLNYLLSRYFEDQASGSADPLSERERECLFWVSEGKTTQEIAVILGVSANTVNKYIVSSIQKFGAGNRAMAIAVAIRAGVI